MRWTLVAGLLFGLVVGGLPSGAHADEIVRLNGEANLRARPGERAPTLAHLEEGQTVRVLGRQGRWLKVSVKGKVGWVTRTQVDDEGEEISARATADKKRKPAAKSRKKGFNSMEDDAVGADAVEEDEEEVAPEDEDAAEEAEAQAELDEDAPKKKAKKVAKAEPKKKAKPAPKKMAKKTKKAKRPAAIGEGDAVVLVRTAPLHEKPSKKADELWDVEEGAELTVVGASKDKSWFKVEDSDGESGWIMAKNVARAGGDEVASADEDMDDDAGDAIEDSSDDDSGRSSRGIRKKTKRQSMWIGANADLGLLSRQQVFQSDGTGIRANYGLSNTAPAVIVGAGLVKPMGSYNLGAEATVFASVGGAGIQVAAEGGMGEVLAWKALQIDVRAKGEYVLSRDKGYAVSGRLGYHTAQTVVQESTTAKLPSEVLSGFTAGVGFAAPRVTDKIGVSIGADVLLGGKLAQTQGLTDGTSTAAGYYLNAGGMYAFSRSFAAHASYQLNYEGFQFTGTNEREPTVKSAARQDLQHVFGVGMSYVF